MSRLGFFGGSFNPITIAHVDLILKAIDEYSLDKVYFVPMNDKYKKQGLLPLELRKDMIEIALEDYPNKMDVFLIDNDKETKAIDSFELIDSCFEKDERFFIMGSDNYKNISSWKNYDKLKEYNFIVLDRENESRTKNISSTVVRNYIKDKKDITSLVSEKVLKYIETKNLYFEGTKE